uniref:Uncharacterized protein n=1 Tax=Nothobranchius furzeri TaxID=105023 RepID=A0A8C6M9V1_NOTFU
LVPTRSGSNEALPIVMPSVRDPVPLNVGGEVYTTTLDTLSRCRDSMLGAMFTGEIPVYILNYLRSGSLDLPHDFSELSLLRREADFFQIRPLLEEIDLREASVRLLSLVEVSCDKDTGQVKRHLSSPPPGVGATHPVSWQKVNPWYIR